MARVSKLQTSRNKSMPIIDQLTAAAAAAAGNTQKRVAKVGQTKNNWPAESAAEEATPATTTKATTATSSARHKTLALANLLRLKDSQLRQLCWLFFLVYQQWGISD